MVDVNHPLDDGLPVGGPANAVSSWAELEGLADGPLPSLRNLFEGDATRGARLSIECADLWIDLSRQHLTDEVLGHLHDLACQRRVSDTLTRVLHGYIVNGSEDRAAIHGALRIRDRKPSRPDVEAAFATFDQMVELATAIRAGTAMGATGHRITALVQLGIGGSHLGPALAVDALRHLAHPDLVIRFSPGVDADDLAGDGAAGGEGRRLRAHRQTGDGGGGDKRHRGNSGGKQTHGRDPLAKT